MKRKLPQIKGRKIEEVELDNFVGMNNTTHPTLLPLNVPSNIKNSYFQDGVFDKRKGYEAFGAPLTSKIIENFTSVTYKDAETISQLGNNAGSMSFQYPHYVAQSVTPISTSTYLRARILSSSDFYDGDMTVRIETDNSNKPSGTLVSENATSTISQAGSGWSLFYFTGGVKLTGGTKYWIVLVPPSPTGATFDVETNSNAYSGGSYAFSADAGATWTVDTTKDIAFSLDSYYTTADWSTDGSGGLLSTSSIPGTSTVAGYLADMKDRHSVVSLKGVIFMTYYDGTNLVFTTSHDKGVTWATKRTISALDSSYAYWSICIDSSDNIYVVYQKSFSTYSRKLSSVSGGIWNIGAEKLINTSSTFPTVAITSDGILWSAFLNTREDPVIQTYYSTNGGTSWTSSSYWATSGESYPILVADSTVPVLFYYDSVANFTYVKGYVGSYLWSNKASLFNARYPSVCFRSINSIWLVYTTSTQIVASEYNLTSFSDTVVISSSANDKYYNISTDGHNLWVVWSKYEAANQYELTFKLFNGASWDSNSTDITANNGNNIMVSLPEKVMSLMPITWRSQTSSPYNVNVLSVQLYGRLQSSGYDSSSAVQTYLATVTSTLNGGTVATTYADSADNSTFGSFTSDITTLTKRYVKFSIYMTTTNLAAPPTVSKVEITASGVSIVSSHSWTKPGTTEKYLIEIGGTNLYMYDPVDDDYKILKSDLTNGLRTTAVGFSEGAKSYFVITNGTDSVMRFNGKVSTGTNVTVAANGTTVTGTGTTWKNTPGHMDQLVVGGKIKIGTTWHTIGTLTDDTHLEITPSKATGSYAYEAYAINTLGGLSAAGIDGKELKGKYVAAYKNQLILAGIPNYESWVQVSAYLSGTTWTYGVDASGNPTFTNGSGAININTNDGQIITALVPFGNSVQIHKTDLYNTKKSVYSLTRNVESWTNLPVTTQYAAVSQNAAIATSNAVYFIDSTGPVMTNGVTFRKIDDDISSTTARINQSVVRNSIVAYNVQEGNEFLFFGVPLDDSTTNDNLLMYDLQKSSWGVMSGLNMGCFAIYSDSYTPELYFGDQLNNSRVLKWNSGTSDDGQPIEWIIETAELSIGKYFAKKKMKHLYAFFEPTGAYDVTAYYSLNGGAYVQLQELVDVSGTTDVFKRWALPGINGSTIKFKLYNNEKDQDITLVRLGVATVEKGLRRI